MLVVLLVIGFLYSGVRGARGGGGNNAKQTEVSALKLSVAAPAGWRKAKQGGVGKNSQRYAWGAPGSKQEAMFVIFTELNKKTGARDRQFLAEVERGLRATGARAWKRSDAEVDGEQATRYRYTSGKLTITSWFVTKGKREWQFSCQARSSAMTARCARFVREVSLD
jgi:hypothetical protein